MLDDLFRRLGVSPPDVPLRLLRELAGARRALDSLEPQLIAHARRAGWTWTEIGQELGISRQAVRRRQGCRIARSETAK